MKIKTIHCENGNDKSLWAAYEERLFDDLTGTVFHLTSQHAFKLIQESESIEHNKKNGRFKINTASENSFVRKRGWVCFFDLRNTTSETINDTLENRYDFLCPHGDISINPREDCEEYSLAYLILDSTYYDHLIPDENFSDRVGGALTYPVLPHHRTYSSYTAVS
jgi:hypothetical protein